MGETDLKHKILAIAEEEGAERAAYALKLLQSEGVLTIASTGKDPHTGRLVTHEYRVEGPVMIFLTTTAIEIDEELLNRCIVLTVDENREQTRAIHRLQREAKTLEGLLAKHDRERILALHRNAAAAAAAGPRREPFARRLTFLDGRDAHAARSREVPHAHPARSRFSISTSASGRRSRCIAGQEIDYIEVTLDDIALANRLAHEVLGRSLDELAPQTRRLLDRIESLVDAECAEREIERSDVRFTQKSVRDCDAAGATSRSRATSGSSSSSSICSSIAAAADRASSTSFSTTARARTALRSSSGLDRPSICMTVENRDSSEAEGTAECREEQPGSIQGAPGEHGGSIPGRIAEGQRGSAHSAFPKPKQTRRKQHQGLKRKRRRSYVHLAVVTVIGRAERREHARPARRSREEARGVLVDVAPGTLGFYVCRKYLEDLEIRNYSPHSIRSRKNHLRYFLVWCDERGVMRPEEITVAVLERYQRALYYARKSNGRPLTFRSQNDRLGRIKRFFRWMAKQRHIEMSPAETMELPRIEQRLPKVVLSIEEVETVLAQPDLKTPLGIRDRAMLELLYSTGMRRPGDL